MVINISKDGITQTINNFPSNYHTDYFRVRKISRKYLSSAEPEYDTVNRLADVLRKTLLSWGAGRRMAPTPKDTDNFVSHLMSIDIHNKLKTLSSLKVNCFGLMNGKRTIEGILPKKDVLNRYDSTVMQLLNKISKDLFLDNTNVTYPMKTVLLLTAHMPALDGNVRKGLSRGGFKGFNTTRYLLPRNYNCADGKKIVCLPYFLGKCWNDNEDAFIKGIKNSRYPELIDEAGRVFDIILFEQSNENQAPIIKNRNVTTRWYGIV